MRVLAWLFWLLIFMLMFWIALKNADPVTLRLTSESALTAPLVIVILVTFAAGVLLGVVTASPRLFRQGREIRRLKKTAEAEPASTRAADAPLNPPDVPSIRS
jgi:lipopolysaccharide assembly protein A